VGVIEDARGHVDHEECGDGPTVVLVPGSCSTGATWASGDGHLDNCFRCVTTSLIGYGGTAERRTLHDTSIWHEADALESSSARQGTRST
jgi:pimeloyl-ACP methyl ester carboxylesterase